MSLKGWLERLALFAISCGVGYKFGTSGVLYVASAVAGLSMLYVICVLFALPAAEGLLPSKYIVPTDKRLKVCLLALTYVIFALAPYFLFLGV